MANLTEAQQALKKFFGYDSFRPMQADIIQRIFDGNDALVLMPTGGGKSICFQVPALVLDGVCVVVSPLIALMKDQVEGLLANGVPAAFLNSSQSYSEQQAIEAKVVDGHIKLLYVSPEKLLSQGFFNFLRAFTVSLFAIDEAHCISSWGHDFRPEYTQLKLLKEQFSEVPIIALTATADKATRKDIVLQLGMAEPEVFVASFDRPNLSLAVRPGQQRIKQLVEFVNERPGQSGIIYCLSRKETEEVCFRLQTHGIKAEFYHAGMTADKRSKVQESFIKDSTQIITATIAFGMGIDKSNIRWVIHYNLPKNMEGYYQEIGRAGRDGLPSDTLLFYSYADVVRLQSFNEESSQAELMAAKLDRMKQFAEASICRRRILLSYFGEDLGKDCGNCDVCLDPPKRFEGTVIAQKALSAVARMQERVGVGLLIDVLRGSQNKAVLEHGFHQIKTYGAGRDISYNDWQQLIWQLLNLGLLEIAYDEGHTLKLTAASKEVLFGTRNVELIKPVEAKAHAEQAKEKIKPERESLEDMLFEVLRTLRKEIADSQGIAPYLVFSDATLKEMCVSLPVTESAMSSVSGVGQKKMEAYGAIFLETIIGFIVDQTNKGAKIKGSTYLITYDLYKRGRGMEEICQDRQLNISTIETHLVYLYDNGFSVNIEDLVSSYDIEQVGLAVKAIGWDTSALKPLAEYLGPEFPYGKIRLAAAYWKKFREVQ